MERVYFDFIAQNLHKCAGIVIGPDKTYLVESRLAPVARREGFNSIEELIDTLRTQTHSRLMEDVIDAMTTNETFFYRDKTPFEHLEQTIFPKLVETKTGNTIRILCAAASTGQEPYSIAMMIDKKPALIGNKRVEIIATDISQSVLDKAEAGLYTQFEVQRGLPIQYLMKYFTQQNDMWRLTERIRSQVRFRKHNLLDGISDLGKFDIILCRNVLIYFDVDTKRTILDCLAKSLIGSGYLILGAAETVIGLSSAFSIAEDKRGLYVCSPSREYAA